MANAKHTPGPWSVSRFPGVIVGGKVRKFANGSAQSQVAQAVMSEEVDNPETRDANARLIAAAPALLERAHVSVAILHATALALTEVGSQEIEQHLAEALRTAAADIQAVIALTEESAS